METIAISQTETLNYSPQQIGELMEAQHAFFTSGVTHPLAFRKGQLNVLRSSLKRFEKQLLEALYTDLRKDEFEAYGTEIGLVYQEIDHAISHLQSWVQPQRVPTPLMFAPGSSYVIRVPLGLTLHISPWNYPVNLCFASLVPAIAGGNTAIVKPSELAPATEAVLSQLFAETFEPDYIACITGPGHLVTEQLIEKYHFNHIFYTGSTAVGRIIMQAAAKHLSPVTLELGGKSPCVVAEDADVHYAAKKIVFAKGVNAGQTCVAPDYVLVHESRKQALIDALQKEWDKQYGTDAMQSPHYGRIINRRQLNRLKEYLAEGNLVYGGRIDEENLYMQPTIITGLSINSRLMQEEIFGPILPVLGYADLKEALQIIDANPYPLSFYLFTNSRATEHFFTERVRFGGGCINNALIHLGVPGLPFGGVGYSGMGSYHGKAGFDTFTHAKSIHKSRTWADVPVWYAPRKDWYKKALRFLMKSP